MSFLNQEREEGHESDLWATTVAEQEQGSPHKRLSTAEGTAQRAEPLDGSSRPAGEHVITRSPSNQIMESATFPGPHVGKSTE